jgi:hypothetical protein
MKKHLRMVIVLVVVILVATMSTAQASQPNQADNKGTSVNLQNSINRSWGTDYIYTNGDAGSDVSIAFDPDHDQAAWISYFNGTYGSLWVAHFVGASGGGNCGPSNLWYCEQVDQVHAETKGWFTSIDIFPDINPDPMISTWRVGISYYDYSHRSLKYAVYRCPPMYPCYWTIDTVDSSTDDGDLVGQYTSMKFDSAGIPHIAYYVYDDPDPTYALYSLAHATFTGSGGGNCGDSNDWYCEAVDSSTVNIGEYPSIDIDWNDNVYIAYYESAYNRLAYAYFAGAGIGLCGDYNAWICLTIDDPAGSNVGLFPSFHAPQDSNDYLRVAYYDTTNGRLKYATGPWPSGNCGPSNSWSCFYIDDIGADISWVDISLAVDSDLNSMIAYTDAHEDLAPLALKVAGPTSGPPYNTCTGVLPDWLCVTVDSGNQYVNDGKYVALGINPDGWAMIAYSEQEVDYPGNFDLKLAYQIVWSSFLPLTIK